MKSSGRAFMLLCVAIAMMPAYAAGGPSTGPSIRARKSVAPPSLSDDSGSNPVDELRRLLESSSPLTASAVSQAPAEAAIGCPAFSRESTAGENRSYSRAAGKRHSASHDAYGYRPEP